MALPNPFKAIKNVFTKSYWVSKVSFLFGEASKYMKSDYLDSYEVCWLVNACIDRIAEAVSVIDLKLYQYKAGFIDEKDEDPLLDLIDQMNPFMTRTEMLEITETFLKILGNAYWLKIRNDAGKVIALWPLRPDWVKINYSTEKFIDSYQYIQPGLVEKYDPKDIIHFKQINPKDPFYGLGTVGPAIDVIKTIIFTSRWNMNFFYNSARPDALLVTKAKMNTEEKEEFKRDWHSRYGGWENAHRLGILTGEVDYKPVNFTMREMQFERLHDVSVNDVLAAFGVPKPVVAMTTDLNRATADAAIYMFLRQTVKPDMKKIVEKLNECLVPEFGDNLFLDFDDPVPEDREATLNEYDNALRNGWMVINEIRDIEGLPPIEGGWSIYKPITNMPIGELDDDQKGSMPKVVFQKVGELNPQEYERAKKERRQKELKRKMAPYLKMYKLKENVKKELKKELTKYILIKSRVEYNEEKKAVFWNEHEKLLTIDEKIFRTMVRTLFKKQRERVVEAFYDKFRGRADFVETLTKSKYDVPINWEVEKEIFVRVSQPIFYDIIEKRGRRAAATLGLDKFEMTDRILKFIDRKTLKFAEEVNNTTMEKVKDAVKDGIAEHEGIDDIAGRIKDVFKTRTDTDSVRIARTEVLSASNEAELETYDQSGVVEQKEWLATRDDRTRDSHIKVDGEIRDLADKFSNGLKYPGDPSGPPEEIINCRCTLLPLFEETKSLKQLEKGEKGRQVNKQ